VIKAQFLTLCLSLENMNTVRFTIAVCLSAWAFVSNAQSIDKGKLKALVAMSEETHSEAIIIYHNNQLVLEKYFGTGHEDTLIESMSCSKSIVGLAAACLLDDGLLDSLDTPVYHFYPEWKQGRKKEITVEHLLTMTSGLQNEPNTAVEIYPSPDFVQLALAAELSESPGETFRYNNKSLNLMAGIFEKAAGKRMDIYIAERLFEPMGITTFGWTLDDAGNPHVMSGCQIRPRDFAKLGLLLLNHGSYDGKQIISEANLLKVVQPTDQYKGYGLLWWLEFEGANYTVDDAIIDHLAELHKDPLFIDQVSRLKGFYPSFPEFERKIIEVFGENPWEYIQSHISNSEELRRKEFAGDIVAYRADGYLGNYIVVLPEKHIVGVRMISDRSYNFDDPAGKDNFPDFSKQVQGLID